MMTTTMMIHLAHQRRVGSQVGRQAWWIAALIIFLKSAAKSSHMTNPTTGHESATRPPA